MEKRKQWGSAGEYLRKNYLSLPDAKSFKGAFSKNFSKQGLKDTFKYVLYGGGLVGLERVSDWYANNSDLRESVYLAGDYISKAIPPLTEPLRFVNDHLTMHALQDYAVNSLGWAPGAFTDHAAEAGAVLAGISLAYLGAKKYLRKKERKKGEWVESFAPADLVDVVKNSPISTAMTGAGIVGHALSLPGYISAAICSVYKTAGDTGAKTVKKSKGRFSGIMDKLNDFYYNADIL